MRCSLFLVLFVSMGATPQTQYEVRQSDGTLAPSSLPREVLFDLRAASSSAQQALLPLYQQEWELEQQLSTVKWQALSDTLMGLAAIGASTIGAGSTGTGLANDAAAIAGVPGVRFKGTNAALSAIKPADMYESVSKAMYLVNQIQATNDAISRTQRAYGLPATARTPWSMLFPSSKTLTPVEVNKLLEPAAKAVAKVSSSVEYFKRRNALEDAAHLALKNQAQCVDRHGKCADDCAAGHSPLDLGGATKCYSTCPSCMKEQAAFDSASQAEADFEKFNNYGFGLHR